MRWHFWQKGCLLTCGYWRAFPVCVLDNLAYGERKLRLVLRRRTGWSWLFHGVVSDGPVARWHHRATLAAMNRQWGDGDIEDEVSIGD